jgi:hypothetical protein
VATERRPYHLVADSVLHEPWTNDQFAFLGRLQAHLHERWRTDRLTAKQASLTVVTAGALQQIAGTKSLRTARRLAIEIQSIVSLRVIEIGSSPTKFSIEWPKFADFQRLDPQTGAQSGHKQAPPNHRPSSSIPKEDQTPKTVAPDGAVAWLRVLSKEPGSEVEKRAFLDSELVRIEAEAFADLPLDRAKDKRALHALVHSKILGWYRQRTGRGVPSRAPSGPQKLPHVGPLRLTAEDYKTREVPIVHVTR